jgi:putative resolvase
MWKAGQLPVPAEQIPTRTILIKESKAPAHAVGLYARVCSSEQRKDLEAQLGRLAVYAHKHRLTIVEAVSEVGSGWNGRRPKLLQLLANPQIQTIVVEHRDRFMGFGAEYVEAALAAQGRKLLVMESSERKDDLVQDMIEVLTWFCARLYGRRWARNKAKKAVQALES